MNSFFPFATVSCNDITFQSNLPMVGYQEFERDKLWQGGEGKPRGSPAGAQRRENHLCNGVRYYVQVCIVKSLSCSNCFN